MRREQCVALIAPDGVRCMWVRRADLAHLRIQGEDLPPPVGNRESTGDFGHDVTLTAARGEPIGVVGRTCCRSTSHTRNPPTGATMNTTRKLIAGAIVAAAAIGGGTSMARASGSDREAEIKVWVPRSGDVAGVGNKAFFVDM